MRSTRSFVLFSAGLLAVVLLSGCPSPFGYYSSGNDLVQKVQTADSTPASPVATPIFTATQSGGGASVAVSGSPTESFDQLVSIASATTDAKVYYTIDGSEPNPYSVATKLYNASQPISVAGNGTVLTIKAIALKSLMLPSAVATLTMTISYTTASTPAFDTPAGNYNNSFTVTITDSTPGVTIWYTTDGSAPVDGGSANTLSGTSPISVTVNKTMTLTALASGTNYSTSSPVSAVYTLSALAPVISVSPIVSGSYIGGETVTITAQTGGSVVWYTTDGTTPIPNSSPGGNSTASFTLWGNTVVNAVATVATAGWSPSPTATQSYTTGLQLYYPFKDIAGSPTTPDLSGNGWTAAINGASLVAGHSPSPDGAYSFDGVSSTITATTSPRLFPTTSTVSVALWVNCATSTPGLDYFVRTNDAGIGVWQQGTQIGLAISTPTTNSAGATVAGLVGAWHFIVGTWDGTTIQLYVDGAFAGTGSNSGTITPSGLTMGYFNSVYWPGTVDDLRIYDRVLTPAEVTALYAFTY